MVTKTKPPVAKPLAAPPKPAKAPVLKTPVTVKPLLMSGGDHEWVIHQEGCPQFKRDKARSQYKGIEPDYTVEGVLNQRDVIVEVWDDIIREQWAEESKENDKLGDDYTALPWSWLTKNGFVTSVKFHTCLDGLPQQSQKAKDEGGVNTRQLAKRFLATAIAEAAGQVIQKIFDANAAGDDPAEAEARAILAGFKNRQEMTQCTANWLHGMPTDRPRFIAALTVPQRSDWSAELRERNERATAPEQPEENEKQEEEGTPNPSTEA